MTQSPLLGESGTHRIRWIEADAAFDALPGETVLDAAVRAGIALPSECGFGACGSCRMKLMSGAVRYDEPPTGLSDEEAAAGYGLACQGRPYGDLLISTDRPLASPVPPQVYRARVHEMTAMADSVVKLTLSLPELPALSFRPGQYLRIHLGEAGSRSFSMASLPGSNLIELHIRRIPGGYFTGALLDSLTHGDVLDVELPLGGFGYHEEDYRPIVLLATGTGIVPFVSMLQTMLPADCPPVSLYWGGRTVSDLYLDRTLAEWAERYPDFVYTPVLSRPGAAWRGARGYVQDAALADIPDLSEHAIYLCGSPTMIGSAKDLLLAHGGSARYLYSDSFTFHHATPHAAMP